MSEIRIRVGSEVIQLCGPGDQPLPVELVDREIENSLVRQSGGEADRLPWRVHRCARADAGRACGVLRLFPGPKPSFDDEWVVSDTNRECRHGMKLAVAEHVVALHNASIARRPCRRDSDCSRPDGHDDLRRRPAGPPGGHAVYSREALLRMTDEALEAQGGMVRGLARAAAAYEAGEGGSTLGGELWDDEMRSALVLARELRIAPPRCAQCTGKTIELDEYLPGQEKSACPACGQKLWKLRGGIGDAMAELMKWVRWASTATGTKIPGDLVRGGDELRARIDVTLGVASTGTIVPTANLAPPPSPMTPRSIAGLAAGIVAAGGTLPYPGTLVDASASPAVSTLAPGIDEVAVEACARVAYDVYRVAFVGDDPMPDFDALDHERRLHVLRAARAAVSGTTPEAFHAEWTSELARGGWTAAPELSEDAKTHPNLVPYGDLPDEQHLLDELFFAAATATHRELGRVESAWRVPTLKLSGELPPEQFAKFKRKWEQQVVFAGGAARKTLIVDPALAFPTRPQSAMLRFVDDNIDSMLRTPEAWGGPAPVELQVLLLLEVRVFELTGAPSADVTTAFCGFIARHLGDAASASTLSVQLEERGRAGEFAALMREFVAEQRAAFKPVPPAVELMLGSDHVWGRREMLALFEKHCECRPVNTARPSHSHDCDTGITDDVRTVIHRVVEPGDDEMTRGELRAATDDEVRAARGRLAEIILGVIQ